MSEDYWRSQERKEEKTILHCLIFEFSAKTELIFIIFIMPIRPMKENAAEQHLVIKPPQFQNNNSMVNNNNTVFKNPKTAQNGKGPPPPPSSQEPPQNKLLHNQSSPPSARNRGRRRGRGARKSDQSDALLMPPSSRPCTGAYKPAAGGRNGSVDNGGGKNSLSVAARGPFPSSSKSLSFAPRPGYGQLGTKCIVKANHFFAELPDKDLNQYDVSSKHILWSTFWYSFKFTSLSFSLSVTLLRGGGEWGGGPLTPTLTSVFLIWSSSIFSFSLIFAVILSGIIQ